MKIYEIGKPALAGVFPLLLWLFSFSSIPIHAAIVEVGDLNVIDDAGNPSNGLRFLDITYSIGLTQSAAIANAQGVYSNARLATPAEFDDLFAAAGIIYSGSLTASDAFETGVSTGITSYPCCTAAVQELTGSIGATHINGSLALWTIPDGSRSVLTTRDYIFISSGDNIFGVDIRNSDLTPPQSGTGSSIGWLLVSEAAAVPIPAAGWLLISALIGLAGKKRLSHRPAG